MLPCLRRVAVHLYHLFCPSLPPFLWVLYPWPISRYYLVALLGRPWGFSSNTCIVTWGSMCHIRQQICTLQDHLSIFQREKVHVPSYTKILLSFLCCLNLKQTLFATERATSEEGKPQVKSTSVLEGNIAVALCHTPALMANLCNAASPELGNVRAGRVQCMQLDKHQICTNPGSALMHFPHFPCELRLRHA